MDQEEEKAGIPEWVVTFGDMMSLLLTFFILLLSLSEIKQDEKYLAMMESIARQFGYDSSMTTAIPGPAPPRNSLLEKMASLGRSRRAHTLKGGAPVVAPTGSEPLVKAVQPDGDPTVAGVVVFQEGDNQFAESAQKTLRVIARRIAGMPQRIEIVGHTSHRPLPPGSPYRDHYDLAYDRCRKVEKYLIELGINPRRIRIVAAAANEPKYTSTDPLLQQENPRVEVLLSSETIDRNQRSKEEIMH
jgi:chemotaxis protein MotB